MLRVKVHFRTVVGFHILVLVAILATQGICEGKFDEFELDLPPQTVIALGPIFPSIHAVLLLTMIAVRRATRTELYDQLWESLLIILAGGILGFYLNAIWLPTIGGPINLS